MDDLLRRDDRNTVPPTAAAARPRTGRPSSLDDRVRDDIAALDGLDLGQLREMWQKLYRTPAPKTLRRELLIRGCAYQIQVKAYGGLSPKTRRKLLKIAAAAEQGTFTTAGAPRRLRPGTRLVRAYDGKTHVVEVLADGFAWSGQKFRSLSAIAKAISGTNWNGHVFFGLTRPTKAPRAGRSEAVDA
ncbi:MAG: DUF2924 domain-containing protein [Devosia sp.]|nr:DUF2924 domain-containing protein [Devosia sp.]